MLVKVFNVDYIGEHINLPITLMPKHKYLE